MSYIATTRKAERHETGLEDDKQAALGYVGCSADLPSGYPRLVALTSWRLGRA